MATVVTKEMGLTHADFYRSFAAVAGDAAWQVDNDVITLHHAAGPINIYLSPEHRRNIAMVSLPVTTLRFEFLHHEQAEVEAFMQRFDRCFRRGGG
jgi:hypothetical protein